MDEAGEDSIEPAVVRPQKKLTYQDTISFSRPSDRELMATCRRADCGWTATCMPYQRDQLWEQGQAHHDSHGLTSVTMEAATVASGSGPVVDCKIAGCGQQMPLSAFSDHMETHDMYAWASWPGGEAELQDLLVQSVVAERQ